jgi:endonuclease/exonuclease/phosphatase family metal-dependent hydrolase
MPKFLKLRSLFTLVALVTALTLAPAAGAQTTVNTGKATVKVMTYNVFQGTDFVEVLSAQSLADYLSAAQLTLQEVTDSNIPARMQAIAHQIAINQPDLVGLEEMTLWRYGLGPDPTEVLYDPLQDLMNALAAQGQHYVVAVVVNEYELQGPLPDLMHYLRANGRNILLARSDETDLQISNPQTASFHTLLQIPDPLLGNPTIVRGWGSVDVALHGQNFRFIVTHLENPIPQIPESYLLLQAQAKELSDVPANTSLPIILVGDFNAIANEPADPSNATYQEMLNLGFGDAWAERTPPRPGLTWPLLNSSTTDTATQRIDFVFYRGLLNPLVTSLAGDMKNDRVDGMWPSDHAGLRALLQVNGN